MCGRETVFSLFGYVYYKCFFTKTQETVLNIFRRFPNKIFPEGAFPTGRGPVFERKREKGFVI
ncbi:hypothetical protein B5F35_03865 [Anaeromassilibacillus sp. An200]|nr:hypothetical protein B5F35_03865 [Anaeromassilibacillus sp. An200]